MTQVDFYLLPENTAQSAELFACRLSAQLYKQAQKIYLLVNNEEDALRLDELLWQFKADAFVPHERLSSAQATPLSPVVIGPANLPVPRNFDVLINLSDNKAQVGLVKRIVELALNDERRRERMRELYRLYRQEGCQLKTHQL